MIGQTMIGKSFGGCVRYTMEKEGAEVLDQSGVRSESPEAATQDFNAIRKQNPNVQKAVWHTTISFAYTDNVDNEKMREIASDYVERSGLKDSQYLVVRHHDTKHQHMHIVANRVTYDGQTVSDRFSKNRTARICDELEEKYDLTVAREQGKTRDLVNDKVPTRKELKMEINEVVKLSLEQGSADWKALETDLRTKGIEIKYQQQSTGRINGVSFKKGSEAIKGSAVDKSFSYGRLNKQLEENRDQGKSLGYELR